eukprot:TRINITY_DN3747_c0_g1_i1.p1 TRINITY_DN3747_c0_g1~~TRINITY_DN3747_c0_g1_i1.p1  ORF type:complete len:222 (+),score=68.91 TRINITY_DN3747_c0_g1_i1:72-737(+)
MIKNSIKLFNKKPFSKYTFNFPTQFKNQQKFTNIYGIKYYSDNTTPELGNGPREGNNGKPFFADTHFSRDESGNKVYPEKISKIVSQILELNLAETVLITDLLQDKLGITNEQLTPSMMFGGGMPQQQIQSNEPKEVVKEEKQPEAPKKTSFNIKLTNIAEGNKIKVLKVIRNLKKGMALMESKELIDKLPSVIGENVPTEEAEVAWKKALEEVGATVELF